MMRSSLFTIAGILGLQWVDIDQGAFCHERVKPTTLLSGIPEITALHGTKCPFGSSNWPDNLDDRLEAAKKSSGMGYSGLVQILQQAKFPRKQGQSVYGPWVGQMRRNPEA